MSLEQLKTIIKDKPVSEILALYISVTKRGAQTLAVCPFHDDHSPSMDINDTKGMFFCFVDQIGGDSIKFVQLFLNIDYKEALKDISEKLGLNFESYLDKNENPKLKSAHYLLEKTTMLYTKFVWDSPNQIFQDFLKKRGLSDEIAKTYRLGFAPKNSLLSKYFSSIKDQAKRKETLTLASQLALLRENTRGESDTYDYFRERIMFPIWDHFGNVIGFTSRAISDSQKAKYMNSMESFLFKKRDLLYGFHLAKQSIRASKSVIVVEGNMDQIALFKEGFKNSVAIMGTAIGHYSLTTLAQMANTIYLALDNDQAGINAANRVNAQFMEVGILPKMVDLSPCKDPDDFLIEHGPLEFQKRIDQAQVYLDQQLQLLIPEKAPETTDQKLKILTSIYPVLAPLSKEIEVKARLGNIAEKLNLNLDLQTIYSDFLEAKKKDARTPKKNAPLVAEVSALTVSHEKPNKKLIDKSLISSEKILISELTLYPELLTHCDVNELLVYVNNQEISRFVLGFGDFMLEIDEQVYAKTVLTWANEQKISTEITTLIGASIYQYRNTRPNDKVLLKMTIGLKYRLKEEYLKSERANCLLENSNNQSELSEHLLKLSAIDKEISNHKKLKKKNYNNKN